MHRAGGICAREAALEGAGPCSTTSISPTTAICRYVHCSIPKQVHVDLRQQRRGCVSVRICLEQQSVPEASRQESTVAAIATATETVNNPGVRVCRSRSDGERLAFFAKGCSNARTCNMRIGDNCSGDEGEKMIELNRSFVKKVRQ